MTENIKILRKRVKELIRSQYGKIHHNTYEKYNDEFNKYTNSKKMLTRLETKLNTAIL